MDELLLVLHVDLQRYGFAELEDRTTIERSERLARELELHGHHAAFGLLVLLESGLAVTRDAIDLRFREHRGIELRRLFGLVVEPQAGRDIAQMHGRLLFLRMSTTGRTPGGRIDIGREYFPLGGPAVGRCRCQAGR